LSPEFIGNVKTNVHCRRDNNKGVTSINLMRIEAMWIDNALLDDIGEEACNACMYYLLLCPVCLRKHARTR
jgi:hypothetical protein